MGDLRGLEEKRKRVGQQLINLGDMRQGTVYERYSKCGKKECHCSTDESYLHGPKVSLTRKAKGKTVLRTIPKVAVEVTKAQVAKYRDFKRLSQEFLLVNEEICEVKLTEPEEGTDQKKTSKNLSKSKLREK